MAQVVRIPTEAVDILDFSDKFIEDLRGLVYNDSRPYDQLAGLARLHWKTVERFAQGDTKKPHANTIIRLIGALGFRLAVVPMRMGRVRGEINLELYRTRLER